MMHAEFFIDYILVFNVMVHHLVLVAISHDRQTTSDDLGYLFNLFIMNSVLRTIVLNLKLLFIVVDDFTFVCRFLHAKWINIIFEAPIKAFNETFRRRSTILLNPTLRYLHVALIIHYRISLDALLLLIKFSLEIYILIILIVRVKLNFKHVLEKPLLEVSCCPASFPFRVCLFVHWGEGNNSKDGWIWEWKQRLWGALATIHVFVVTESMGRHLDPSGDEVVLDARPEPVELSLEYYGVLSRSHV